MSQLTRAQAELTRINARIVVVEAQYDAAAQLKSTSHGFGVIATTKQDFDKISAEYHRLLDRKEALEAQIDALNGVESGSYVATFRPVSV